MNLISDVLMQKPEYKISVFTSINSSPFQDQKYLGVKILRLGSVSNNSIIRYFSYLNYNIIGTIILLITRPEKVLIFESLSIFPAYIYSKVFTKKAIHIHFHEYISIPEKESSSLYMIFLFYLEDKLLRKYTSSQTNEDRKELFLKDHTYLKTETVAVFPNMPPSSWWTDWGKHKESWNGGKIKLVYVGVLDSETMYLEEVLHWVKENPEELELTLISHQGNSKTEEIIQKFKSNNIIVKSAIDYYCLPMELVKYDIGLVLYKGHIPNYVYNVPNKVYEYLNCGLMVLVDDAILSLKRQNILGVIQSPFKEISQINMKDILNFQTSHVPSYSNSLLDTL